jgi:FkbM family methyltransferase
MIYSFEPLSGPYQLLKQSFADDALFQTYPIALGETCGRVEIYENGQSDFSSMLPMNVSCRDYFPTAEDETVAQVQMMTLDRWAQSQSLTDPLLIKMDVQGYEDRVIRGGIDTIHRASVIMTEVSFTPLYRFQPLFHDVYTMLHSMGFRLIGMIHNMYDVSESNIVQADAIFESTGRLGSSPSSDAISSHCFGGLGSLP